MIAAMRTEEMTFRSEGVDCAARIYRPDVAPGEATSCVVMANGFIPGEAAAVQGQA